MDQGRMPEGQANPLGTGTIVQASWRIGRTPEIIIRPEDLTPACPVLAIDAKC
jgi:hypothetical protein